MAQQLQIDSTSDSWLSKNVRPILVLSLAAATIVFIFVSPFYPPGEVLVSSFGLLKESLSVAIGFYFTSRGVEKVQKIRTNQFGQGD